MIAETLRLELNNKIKVTLISPGLVDTNFFNNLESGQLDINSIGFGALKTSDVANAIMYALNADNNATIKQIILRPDNQIF